MRDYRFFVVQERTRLAWIFVFVGKLQVIQDQVEILDFVIDRVENVVALILGYAIVV